MSGPSRTEQQPVSNDVEVAATSRASKLAGRRGPQVIVRDQLGPYRRAWDDLVAQAPLPSSFLRSWWLEATASARPCFVLVVEGRRLLGGMALQQDRFAGVDVYRVLGDGWLAPDHLDAVAAEGHDSEVVSALAAWCSRPGPRMFDLDGVVEDSLFARVLPPRVTSSIRTVAPYRRFDAAREGSAAEPRGRARTSSRRGRRRLERDGGEHRIVRGTEVDAALERLRELHARRWGAGSGFLGLFEPFAAAAREGARRDEVVVHELVLAGTVVASLVEFWLGNRACFYQHGHDADGGVRSPGAVVMGYAVENAANNGLAEYDLLRGTESYKADWADGQRRLLRLRAAHGRAGHLAWHLLDARQRLGEAKGRTRRRTWALVRRLRSERDRARGWSHSRLRSRERAEWSTNVLDDPDQLEPLREQWDALDGDRPSPNGQIDHVLATADHLEHDEQLLVVTVTHGGELVGAAPLVRTGRPQHLRNHDTAAASTFLYRDQEGLDRLVDAVLGLGYPLDLDALVAGSHTDATVRERSSRWVLRCRHRDGGPSIPLDETWEDPLTKLTKSRRKDLERSLRRADRFEGEITFDYETPGDLVGDRFDELVEVEARSWKHDAGTALAQDDRRREILRRYLTSSAVRGQVRSARMRIGDTTAAIDIGVVIDGCYWGLKGGVDDTFRPCSPGLQLKVINLREAAREGIGRFEFMGASAHWKEMWGSGPTPLHHLRLFPPNARGALALSREAASRLRRRSASRLERGRGGSSLAREGAAPPEPEAACPSLRDAVRRALQEPGTDVETDRDLSVRIVGDAAGLEVLREQWRRLQADVPGPSSHLDWILAYAWGLPTDEQLCVVTLHRHGRLTGVAPLTRTTGIAPRLKMIILAASGFLYRDESQAEHLVDAVLALPYPLTLDLLVEGCLTHRLAERTPGRLTVSSSTAGAPSIQLDESWQDPLSKLSSRRRKDLRRRSRRAEELGEVSFELHAPGDDLDRIAALFDAFVELEGRGWKGRNGTAMARDDRRREMMWRHTSAPEVRPQLRFATMHIDDRLVAIDIAVMSGGRWWGEKSAYDEDYAKLSPGQLLNAFSLSQAAQEGASTFEFGGLTEPYKEAWGSPLPLVSLKIYGPNLAGALAVVADAGPGFRRRLQASLSRPMGAVTGALHRLAPLSMDAQGRGVPGDVQVVTDPESLEPLREGWHDLRTDVPGPSGDFDHIAAVARTLPDDEALHVVTLSDDRRLVATAPLVRSLRGLGRLRLASRGETMEFLYADRGHLNGLADAVLAQGRPLHLDTLPAGSPTDQALRERARGSALVLANDRKAGTSLCLDESLHDPLERLSSGRRSDLRRKQRRAESMGTVRFEILAPRDDLEERFAEFVGIEGSGWKRREGTALVSDDRQREVLWRYVSADDVRDDVRIARMLIDETTVAADLAVVRAGRYWYIKGGYDERYGHCSPGILLKAYAVGWAAREGLERFEFMGDTEAYKQAWGNGPRQRSSLRVYPFNHLGAAALALDAVGKAVRLVRRSPSSITRWLQ